LRFYAEPSSPAEGRAELMGRQAED
jgi:hypothetical protein